MLPETKVNILLVDDHPANLLALEAILESLGHNLVRAKSGKEALRCLLDQDFAVILLDVQMPEMDGLETAALIRQRERSRHTPIIFLTAFSTSNQMVFQGYALGAVDYLFKPIEPQILTAKIAVFIDLFQKTAEVQRQATRLAAVNAELQKSEQRFRSLSACSPVGIFLTDTLGQLSYTNPRCQVICASKMEGNFQDSLLKLVHPEDRDRVLADWSSWTQTNQEYSNEFRLLIYQPSPLSSIVLWVHVRSSPMLCDQGQFLGHVGTIEDISDRKQAEEERSKLLCEQVARQQAESANRMKDEFLSTLSHELRTPLNSMLGWARLLRTRNFDENTTAKALETIERNAKMQAQLIEDILDVSQIIRGKLQLVLRPVNLAFTIETALDTVRPAAEAKAIQVKTILKSSASIVSGDLNRLQQVILNLLTNAIKFTPEGGKIEMQLVSVDSYAEITISDTGIGINQEFLPHVFERFRQADSTISRSYGGLGLGLAIVDRLVEMHGGTISAYSAGEGQGTTFILKLPLLKVESEQVISEELEEHSSSIFTTPYSLNLDDLQILVVDDEPDVCELLAIALEEYGAQVTAASSVAEAIKVLDCLQPDILISDIGMPEEDGYTLLSKVREIEAKHGWRIPAMALTAYVRPEDYIHTLSSGFQMHMSKPVDTTELIRAIAKLAGRIEKL